MEEFFREQALLCRCCLVFDQSEASIPHIDQSEAALRSVITESPGPVTGADVVTMQWSAPGQVRGLLRENEKEGETVSGTERMWNFFEYIKPVFSNTDKDSCGANTSLPYSAGNY